MATKSSLIQGQVLDARGHPVAGARISWVQAPVAMPDVAMLTDTQGRFVVAAPAQGAYTLRCDSDAHGSVQQALQAAGQLLKITLNLPR
jgi:histidine ammonia-lyase